MKNRLYYTLFLFYLMVVVFILYLNGAFLGNLALDVNLVINLGCLGIIGIIFVISAVSFARMNRCTDELVQVTERMQKEYKQAGGRNLWEAYQDRKDVFGVEVLQNAFNKYRLRMQTYRTKRGYAGSCDLEEYISEELLEQVGMSHFNSAVAGTLTGIGILGTFLGLSMGLGSFSGNDIYTISDNVGPLLNGMKVAFHTSVYGIFFSLIFSFIYRGMMADAYQKLENFHKAFKQFAMPIVVTEDENAAAMVVYQAKIANSLKQIQELLQGNAMEQNAGVERIVNQFMTQMNQSMGVNFRQLGNTLRETGQAQVVYAENCKELIDATAALLEGNRSMQKALLQVMDRQEEFAGELKAQKEKLQAACDAMSDEIGNQLYAFDQMRSLYEK